MSLWFVLRAYYYHPDYYSEFIDVKAMSPIICAVTPNTPDNRLSNEN